MQTALQRRQRHRRNGAARRGRGGGAARRAALAIPLLLFSSFLVLGGVGFISTVSAYAFYSNGLPDPAAALEGLVFEQPSVIYDRTGKVELARFGELRRELLTFDQLPPEMVDATTAIEDKDFWTNPGFDIGAVVSAGLDTISGRPRGASTITQQLVRAKLLPADAFSGSVYDRKIREIIQSIRLTQAYPGEDGKRQIMAAYLNQNFYGNQSYGVAAAAIGYFGKPLAQLDLAQFATLAAIPQSPTKYDLMRNALSECKVAIAEDEVCPAAQVTLVVPDTTEIVARRNEVLNKMRTRSVLSAGKHTAAEFDAAQSEPLVLNPIAAAPWKAPHFVWQVRKQLGSILCSPEEAEQCQAVDTGGYQVTTTLNYDYQKIVEKWLYAAARAPLAKTADGTRQILTGLGIPKKDQPWVLGLRGIGIHNSAGAVIDYRTGQVLAVGGSASYYLQTKDRHFSPQYDVMFDGFRQPGSSIKPIGYITGLDDHTMTAATSFMDVVTEFERNWAPADADHLERGPVRMRPALQFSLNIPAIKSGYINGVDHLFAQYQKFGLHFLPDTRPTPSMAIGTLEIHMIDLLGAYGAIANSGVLMPQQVILEVKDHNGKVVYPTTEDKPVGKQVATPQASYLISNILEGNTIKSVNAYWAVWQVLEKDKRRPAAYKTGTTDESKDIDAFGFVAPPDDPKQPAIAVGVWMGNSDAAPVKPIFSTTSTAPLWNKIITEVTRGTPIASFKRPGGLVEKTVDTFSGMLPGPGTTSTVKELFIKGTEDSLRRDDTHAEKQIDQATGLLWDPTCTGPMVNKEFLDFSHVEPRFPEWQRYTQGWAQRAAKGPGVRGGPKRLPTSYFLDGFLVPFGRTWGGKFAPTDVCTAVVPCDTHGPPTPEPSIIIPCITPEPTLPGPTPTKPGNGHSILPSLAPTVPTAAAVGPPAIAPAAFFPFLVPLVGFVIGRRFRPARPSRPILPRRKRR
jgi:membrane peptidoglycan carboxypeptidase